MWKYSLQSNEFVIWGAGEYCKSKLSFFKGNIVAIVSKEKETIGDFISILPNELCDYKYDYIVIFSSYVFDIISEILEMRISYKKIIPGMLFRPYSYEELSYMNELVELKVLENGRLEYKFCGERVEICSNDDFEKCKRLFINEKNANCIKALTTRPVGKVFGGDRGGSVYRYYIENFLEKYADKFNGNILEVGDAYYTNKYGGKRDFQSYVIKYGEASGAVEKSIIIGSDLTLKNSIPSNTFDCIVMTQVFNFLYDIHTAAYNVIKALKVGGVALITVSAITPISRSDMDRYGHFWNFTDLSIFRLFKNNNTEVKVFSYGNAKVACACIEGMSYKEVTNADLDEKDSDYPVIVCAIVRRMA